MGVRFLDQTVQMIAPLQSQVFRWNYEGLHSVFELMRTIDNSPSLETIYVRFMSLEQQDKENAYTGLQIFLKFLSGLDRELTIFTPDLHVIEQTTGKVNFRSHKLPIDNYGYDFVCFPDEGARSSGYQLLDSNSEIIFFTKKRKSSGGIKLNRTDLELGNKSILVVDDIRDGAAGRTDVVRFLIVVKELNRYSPAFIDLHTTHSIYSQGKKELKKYYRYIVCTHEFNPWSI